MLALDGSNFPAGQALQIVCSGFGDEEPAKHILQDLCFDKG
jgi:hypothetical protein|tara:strand:- start:236 stop:358 length:123 start_codon:yes stop_codon:yes gene_type:complete